MRKTTFTFILILICLTYGLTQPLFKITQNDKIGYINAQGKVIIKPLFYSGYDFSEGLAAVRLNGSYGFINETGKFVIKPDYDLATKFVNGIAAVHKNGKIRYINKKGKIIFPFKNIIFSKFIAPHRAKIFTRTFKFGVINLLKKQLIIDTIYSSISDFNDGVAVVSQNISTPENGYQKLIGVINTEGKVIVPFGKYQRIKPFNDGYALVEIIDSTGMNQVINGAIDTKGNLQFSKSYKDLVYLEGDFNDGYARIRLFKYFRPNKERITSPFDTVYEGYINLKGEIALNDPNYLEVTDFSNNRAFVMKKNKVFILIDRNFKKVGDKEFKDIQPALLFKNGNTIVESDDGVGIIDTSGNFITKSDYYDIHQIGIKGDYFFYKTDTARSKYLFGISDLSGRIIFEPNIEEFDQNGFVNGLLKVIIDEKLSYINKSGIIVWQEDITAKKAIKPFNIDFTRATFFHADSTPKDSSSEDYEGWAIYKNKPKPISSDKFQENLFALTIDTSIIDTIENQFLGFKLFISNRTNDTIQFNVSCSGLIMKLQAQNANGEWQDIEYFNDDWCDVLYPKIELEPNAFWSFSIPKFYGEFQTKIRAELEYTDPQNSKSEKFIYSNSINGGINPGQFWVKRTYTPTHFKDQYNE